MSVKKPGGIAAIRVRAAYATIALLLSRGATAAAFGGMVIACSVYDLSLLPLGATGGSGNNGGGGDASAGGSRGDDASESGGGGDESGPTDSAQGEAGSGGGVVADIGLPEVREADAPVGQMPADSNRPDTADGSRVPDVGTPDVGSPTDSGLVDSTFVNAGYGDNNVWHGYTFATVFGTTATITPVCDPTGVSPCFLLAGRQVCVHGNVGLDPATASGALLGWNLNQAVGAVVRQTVVTTGSGLTVRLSGRATGGLRVQLEDATAKTWCAPLPPGGSTIPWSMFNTTCWAPATGETYAVGTPIQDLAIIVPSTVSAGVSFDFCLVTVQQQP